MSQQPPLKPSRAGIGCLFALLLVAAPFGLYATLSDTGPIAQVAVTLAAVGLAILFGPMLVAWILGLPLIPAASAPAPGPPIPPPGQDDPIHYIDFADRAARQCRGTGPHPAHPYYWCTDMPYGEILPDGGTRPAMHRLNGSAWCEGRS